MTPLAENQILSRVSKFYHDDFRQTCSLLQPHESIIWAGNQAYGLTGGIFTAIGYFLVTSYRGIQVSFDVGIGLFGRDRIYIRNDWNIPALPTNPLNNKEKESRSAREVLLRNISEVQRKDYKVNVQGKEIVLVELVIRETGRGGLDPMIVYGLQDGNEVYSILQQAISREPAEARDTLLDKLERLTALHRSGDLTDAEFEKAKQKLLNA